MKVKAIYEFWAENEAELSFQVGDIITVVNRDDEGWWEGELNGQKGLFPSNYVEAVADSAVSPTAIPPPRASPPAMPAPAAALPAHKPGPPPLTASAPSSMPPVVKPPINNAPISTSSVTIEMKSTSSSSSSSAPAAAASAPREKIRESRTKFGLLSANMALYTGISMIVFGIAGFIWYDQAEAADIISHGVTLYCSIYSFFVGGGILAYEWFFGRKRGPNPFPIRGMVYLILSIFLFLSWPTFLGAFFLLTTACANFAATAMGEVYDAPPKREAAKKKSAEENAAEGIIGSIKIYIASIQQQNKVGTFVFYSLYTVGNIVLFSITVKIWVDKGAQRKALYANDKNRVMTDWVPIAKAFGAILDLNCALILLPVLRTIIRYLYNRSTADQGIISTVLRGILYFVPLDSNLKFHKIIAGVIMGATIAHTVAHFVNFSLRPSAVFFYFDDAWPIVSGGLVCWFMFFIYSAAFENTKRGQFEIFWYSHHFFIFFFVFLFIHGKHGLNPGYWPYIIGPGALYILERGLRIYRANQRVVVLSCTVMDDVFSLEFAKEGIFAAPYKEGQYVFVNSPPISQVQWHPFTISSAPEEKTVTLHIRVCGDGSWTKDLCNYVTAMGPKHATYFSLDRQGPQGKLAGKILGPDGQRMLCLDGPHSAPTQHVGEYSTAMIIGAGIGATPVSATLKSVVFHRWKYFIGQCFPDHAYFMWVCAHRDIDAFRWLIRNIKDAQDEFLHMSVNNQAQMASKTFEFHIWVTSVPKGQKPTDVIIGEEDQIGFWGVPREDAKVEKVRANWDEADLYKTMKCPAPHTTLGNVHVYEGRPNWGPRFQEVSSKHPSEGIGVAFCGNPMIGSDLKKQCFLANQKRNQGFFKLHKENF